MLSPQMLTLSRPLIESVTSIRWRVRPALMLLGLCVSSYVISLPRAWSGEDRSPSFNQDVRPILSDKCFHCHGPDADNQDSEFRLDTQEHALADLGGYFGIKPGDLEASELHARIHATDDGQMPPAESPRQLTSAEKKILEQWILAGAEYESHWSFTPVPDVVAKPTLDAANADWCITELDAYVRAKQIERGLSPNRPASKEAWLRRVTFDLTGLPPAIEEVNRFLHDNSPTAYEKVVDELLQRDACAERLATEWLDVARYADSYGYQRDDARYVWPYRDWVIDSFKKNMTYDQFVTWQLAGDLLPDATREQILATTFNRLHSHKKEGGVAVEEFRVENVADRTHTVGAAFMGLTFECSRCHDHKYDPITMKDYYGLSAYFSNIDEYGLISFFTDAVPTPALALPSEKQERAIETARESLSVASAAHDAAIENSNEAFEAWLAGGTETAELLPGKVAYLPMEEFVEPGKPSKSHLLENVAVPEKQARMPKPNQLVTGKIGSGIRLTGDDPIVIPDTGRFTRDQPFSCGLWIKPAETEQRGVIYRRSRGWGDAGSIGYELTKLGGRLSAKLCHFWPGDAICVETEDVLVADQWTHVFVTYDGSSRAAGLKIYLNGHPAKTQILFDQLTRQISRWRGGEDDLAIGSRYRDRGFTDGVVDDFYAFERELSAIEVQQLFDGVTLQKLLDQPAESLTKPQKESLRQYFLLTRHEASRATREALRTARAQYNAAVDATPAITVMREREQARPTYILERGVYDQPGELVRAQTPEFLFDLPEDQPRNRLGLARWLCSDQHPLLSRVTVNRYWQLMFGTGIVRTPEDFGAQGAPPTHPELLDWLSRDLMNHDWNIRRLLRMMALSATYRQATAIPASVRELDPENQWLARGVSKRLSAEMIRDNVLAVSGLLTEKVGGAPVRPYDLQLSYKPQRPDKGEGLYRRSLYTFWQRTAPAPVMTTLNANKRDVCRLRREVAPSPLQALVILNGVQFVEASRVTAANLLQQHGDNVEALVRDAYTALTSSSPTSQQLSVLLDLVEEQTELYNADPEQAKALLDAGEASKPSGLDPAKHAAVTILVNALMNLDACVRLQ
ncbi:MAG: DUF1553 domain-containing protein [Planctomycetota bacterium]